MVYLPDTVIRCPKCGEQVEFINSSLGYCTCCGVTLMISDSNVPGKVEVLR